MQESVALSKIAAAYEEAFENMVYLEAAEKVASIYGNNLPPGYEEALIKEAVLGAIGGAVTRGAAKAVQKLAPKAGWLAKKAPNLRSNMAKGLNVMRNHKNIVGGAAVGTAAAGLGGGAYMAGRMMNRG